MQKVVEIIKQRQRGQLLSEEAIALWQDWKWQVKHSIREISQVEEIFDVKLDAYQSNDIEKTIKSFPMAITPYYLSLVDPVDFKNDPVFKQAFPDKRELDIAKYDMADPLAEDKDSPVEGVTHRYPDRVLLHISNTCAMYCRHCTRKRKVGDVDSIPSKEQMLKGIEYIKKTPEIRDVLLSGGDPFLLSDEYLDWILGEISTIPHVELVRIGTRTPVVLPYRITDSLIEVLKKYDSLWLNTHFNHPREITEASKGVLKKLVGAGIPLGNQSVLLADINDSTDIMKQLVHKLVQNKVRPYYLYQCDLSEGLEHFRTPIGVGIEIMESLRGHTSGFAVPTYVVDAPGGGGKIPVGPNYMLSWSANKVILRNFEGVITTYHEPDAYKQTSNKLIQDATGIKPIGIQGLLSDFDDSITLTPSGISRREKE